MFLLVNLPYFPTPFLFRILHSVLSLSLIFPTSAFPLPPSKPPPRLSLFYHTMRHALCALLVDSHFHLLPPVPYFQHSALSFQPLSPNSTFRIPHSTFHKITPFIQPPLPPFGAVAVPKTVLFSISVLDTDEHRFPG